MDILEHLSFDFEASLTPLIPSDEIHNTASHATYSLARLKYHRNFELLVNQFICLTHLLETIKSSKQFQELAGNGEGNEKQARVALLSPDLFPETSEALNRVILESFRKSNLEIPTILSRRKTFNKHDLSFSTLCAWSDPETLSKFDIVLITCSNANFPIVKDIIGSQINVKSTIFYPACTAMNYARIKGIIKSDLIILPYCSFDSLPGDSYVKQELDFEMLVGREEGAKLPHLDVVRKVFGEWMASKGLEKEVSLKIINSFVPKSEIEGITWAASFSSVGKLEYELEKDLNEVILEQKF